VAKSTWNGKTKLVLAIVTLAALAVGVVMGYQKLMDDVETSGKKIETHCAEDDARNRTTLIRVRAVEEASIRTKVDMEHIKANIGEQKVILKEIRDEIRSR
jgi:hypothetical protein